MKWYTALVGGFVLIVLVVFALIGIKPRPVEMIKTSIMKDPSHFGHGMYLQLKQRMQNESLVLIGVDASRMDEQIPVMALLNELQNEKDIRTDFYVDASLSDWKLSVGTSFDLQKQFKEFLVLARNAEVKKERIVYVLPNIQASQMIQAQAAAALKQSGLKFLSVSLFPFSTKAEQFGHYPLACQTPEKDEGAGKLGCLMMLRIRQMLNKANSPEAKGAYVGQMELVGEKDVLALFSLIE